LKARNKIEMRGIILNKINIVAAFFKVLFLIIIALVCIYPFYYVLTLSVSDYMQMINSNSVVLFPRKITFAAYKLILTKQNIFRSLLNSVFYAVTGTGLSVLITLLTAYPLSKKNFVGRRFFMFIITVTFLFGAGMVPLFLVVKSMHIDNTIWSVILPFLISPWNLILTRTFFENIPSSLSQSAYIDGANEIQVLYSIILPLSLPIIATISLYYAVGYWNSYFWPMVFLNDKKLYPIQILLRDIVIQGSMANERTSSSVSEPVMSESIKGAVIIVATLPIITVYPFLQRYFLKGMMVGAIKG